MRTEADDNALKQFYTFVIWAPNFTEISGGVRALYRLGHHLRERGFQVFMTAEQGASRPPYSAPLLPQARRGITLRQDIAVYPETFSGNLANARHVVRFLLNGAGVASQDVSDTYSPKDFLVHFDKGHVPAGFDSQDLYTPIVDRAHYHRDGEASRRDGFVIVAKRTPKKPIVPPAWMRPLTVVAPQEPRTHAQLGDLYRSARALVAYERTSAIYEAMLCGCPVICLEQEGFDAATFQRRFEGAGMSWNFSEEGVSEAARTIDRFITIYDQIEADYPAKVESVFLNILHEAARREAD